MTSVTKYFLALLTIYWNLFFSYVFRAIPNWNCLLSINLKLAGQAFDWETKIEHYHTFIHKFNSEIKLMEDYWFVNMGFRNGSDFNNAFSHNAKISFMSKNELMNIRAWADPRSILLFLDSADRGCKLNTNDDIVDVTIFILFHATSSSTDPAP